jgi:MFS family permease
VAALFTARGGRPRHDAWCPLCLDRLPWSKWHWLIVTTLGVTWILDGLEATLGSALSSILKDPHISLGLSDAQIGPGATIYLGGTALTGLSWNFATYALCRFIAGSGIGGKYSAINSAIGELIPARVRGQVDLIINSTYWLGAMLGAVGTWAVLDPHILPPTYGWRFAFLIGAILGIIILIFRGWVPESPRWLVTHVRAEEAERTIDHVERMVIDDPSNLPPQGAPQRIYLRGHTSFAEIWHAVTHEYPTRSILGFTLMVTQAFLYNAIFFTYALILVQFYQVPATSVSLYLFPFALGNLLGPILMGHWFDTIGRKTMITLTYGLSGILLAITGYLFSIGALNA